MKFKNILNELEAEITLNKNKEPVVFNHKVFINGKIPSNIPPRWITVLKEIKSKLIEKGLIDKFSKDEEPMDISGLAPKGDIQLRSDTGEKYIYNIESKKLKQLVKK